MRRAKIVATLGPATSTREQVRALVDAGMDVARLNLSHGSYADHEISVGNVRDAALVTGRAVGLLADLQGPKIRLGVFAGGSAELVDGTTFTITTDQVGGDASIASTTYTGLATDVTAGDPILVDDGRVSLQVVAVDGPRVVTTVIEGGTVSDHKGLNLPGTKVTVPPLTDKDVEDLRWALGQRVDMIALSFVRSADDLKAVHTIMDEVGLRRPVIAKIEKPQAVENLEAIVAAFDGIMVARGDLGVELPLEDVPLVQKRAVMMARERGRPVIVATQMLESMISSSRPTRAEASDVANAVLDGADALMLSGETSVGRYPIESVRTMGRVIGAIEDQALDRVPRIQREPTTKSGAITRAAVGVAPIVDARFLVAFTQTGSSARLLARHRSATPLLAFTPVTEVRNQMALFWGVEPFVVDAVTHTDEMVRQVDGKLLDLGRCSPGDNVVIVAGSPPGIPGSTNAMRVHRIGDAVSEVAPAYARPN